MKPLNILVTGSSGLIGSDAVEYFDRQGHRVVGVDNNMHKGKQVRDNIHSYDVVRAAEEFSKNPRLGEVYNLGGGRTNSILVLEAISRVEEVTGLKIHTVYQEQARRGAATFATSATCASS